MLDALTLTVTEGVDTVVEVCLTASSTTADSFTVSIPANDISVTAGSLADGMHTLSIGIRSFLKHAQYFPHAVGDDYVQLTLTALFFTESSPQDCVTFSIEDNSMQEDTEAFGVQFQLPPGNQF